MNVDHTTIRQARYRNLHKEFRLISDGTQAYNFRQNHRAKLGYFDTERAAKIIKGIEGRRLTFRLTDKVASSHLA